MRVAHHLSDIILDSELFSLRISNEGSNYSHLRFIVGSNKAAQAPNYSQFATDAIKLYRSSIIFDELQGVLNNCLTDDRMIRPLWFLRGLI